MIIKYIQLTYFLVKYLLDNIEMNIMSRHREDNVN